MLIQFLKHFALDQHESCAGLGHFYQIVFTFFLARDAVDAPLHGQTLHGIQAADHINTTIQHDQEMPGFPTDVSIDKHEVCGAWSGKEFGRECVASTTDQAFVGHGFHGPVNAQLTAGIGPLDVTHESAFCQHAAIARHANVYSGGL